MEWYSRRCLRLKRMTLRMVTPSRTWAMTITTLTMHAFMFEVPADCELIEKPAFLPDGEAIKGAFIVMLF